MLVVTHDMGLARQASARIIFMDRGHIVCDESPGKFLAGTGDPRIGAFLASILNQTGIIHACDQRLSIWITPGKWRHAAAGEGNRRIDGYLVQ